MALLTGVPKLDIDLLDASGQPLCLCGQGR